ncbi:MAG TPA: hypothetical protein VK687_02485 [Bryobacteraceae bacterium]|jgi:Arc/MetJ-type ribon-helix-helix transcriptional regulator|nr:hypothetical protein [Bryobacteraceae bacterium]
MTITLRPEQEQLVRELLRSGGYENAADAIDSALEMLRSQNEWLLESPNWIAAKEYPKGSSTRIWPD